MSKDNYDDARAAQIADDEAEKIRKAKRALEKEFKREYPAQKEDEALMAQYVELNLQEYLDYECKNKDD